MLGASRIFEVGMVLVAGPIAMFPVVPNVPDDQHDKHGGDCLPAEQREDAEHNERGNQSSHVVHPRHRQDIVPPARLG